MKKVQKPKFTANKVKPFTKVEIKQLLSAKQSSTLKALQLVLLDTGLRISEALSLQVKDYDVKNGRLYVRSGKGNKDRIVYLGQKTQKVLWKLCSDRTEGFVFKTRNATQINRMNFVRTLHKIAKPLQIKAHPHKYRHTFAVNFLRNGGNIKQLQEILGHSNLDTVNIYLQLAEVDLEQSRTYSPVDNL
jgi:site-specific recombinase XerD